MLRFFRHVIAITIFAIIGGCAGGGCASGCACDGISPLPQGFPPEERIENAASIRVTNSGLDFLSNNLGQLAGSVLGGDESSSGLSFPIPSTSGSQFGIGFDVCPGGPDENANPPKCVAEIDLAKADLSLQATAPHNLKISGPLPIRLQNLPVDITYFFIPSSLQVTLSGNDACPNDNPDFALVQVDADISIEIDSDPTHSRKGYSRVAIKELTINEDDLADRLRFCGGFDAGILNFLKDIIVPLLTGPLLGSLDGQIESALCQPANPDLSPSCPDGTFDVNGICRFGMDEESDCASQILGLDGNVDLGGLLSSISPGASGGFNFLLAAGGDSLRTDGSQLHWGDLNPVEGGMSLGMYGGATPTPLSNCVTPASITLPEGIPMPDEVLANSVPDWPMEQSGPHFGLALSERYANYLLAQMYNSGTLCLGITGDALGDAIPLSTGLIAVALGAMSMNELGHQKESAPLAMALRPGKPPTIEFGGGTDPEKDPLLTIALPELSIDFYVWSSERYVRAMTAKLDLTVPANLAVTPEGLVPVLKTIGIKNTQVLNSQLLREDPEKIALSVETLLSSVVGSFVGDALPTVNINEQLAGLGLTLDIPPTEEGKGSPGLRKLTKGNDDYLGIFATFGTTMTMPAQNRQANTELQITGFDVDPEGLYQKTMTRENAPELSLRFGSDLDDGSNRIEWQYRVDHGPWSPFTSERDVIVRDPWLRAQGRHRITARARIAGDVASLDSSPAITELLVDVEAPRVSAAADEHGRVHIDVFDAVSSEEATMVRFKLGDSRDDAEDASWSSWTALSELQAIDADDASYIVVEARDESENVGSTSQALIRGKGVADAAGCQCVIGTQPPSGSNQRGWWAALGFAALVIGRRRSRKKRGTANNDHSSQASHVKTPRSLRGLLFSLLAIGSFMPGCSCSPDPPPPDPGCRGRGDCLVLKPGLIGAYTSAAVNDKGELWVAGYLEGNWYDEFSFGDLAVGQYDGTRVDWRAVDGIPTEPAVDIEQYDAKGFRGGQTDSGDDVGLWTSIAFDDTQSPAVAYYDKTNRALRYANLKNGTWHTTTVAQSSTADFGRYAKLLFVSGKPVIAYHFSEAANDGVVSSGVRLMSGSSAHAPDANWSPSDVVNVAGTPCRAALCASGTRCVKSTGRCEESSSDCPSKCEDGTKCVSVGGSPKCEAVDDPSALTTYPDAVGLYVSAALTPSGEVGIAYYDRVKGNAMIATPSGSGYTALIVDGESGGKNTGDRGIGISLFIDGAGNYHVTYIDGLAESLVYTPVLEGAKPGPTQVVDDGYSVGGTPHADKQHIVGDDPHILVASNGEVTISYQDASAGTLRYARGTGSVEKLEWSLSAVDQNGFAGYFSRQVEFEGNPAIVNFWRVASPQATGDVRVVRP